MIEEALDVIVQNGFLVRLQVVLDTPCSQEQEVDVSKNDSLTFLELPDTQVSDFKKFVAEKLKIPENEQRMIVKNEKHVLHGSLQETIPRAEIGDDMAVTITLKQAQLDPRLVALFNMVGLEDWKERDEIMNRMCMGRPAGKCYRGHDLEELGTAADTETYDDTNNDTPPENRRSQSEKCKICQMEFVRNPSNNNGTLPHVCRECDFCLCIRCNRLDNGCDAIVKDPYDALEDFALSIAARFAYWGANYGGRGISCTNPRIDLHSEFTPRMLSVRTPLSHEVTTTEPFCIRRETKVLHDGVRLLIRLNSGAVRELLCWEESHEKVLEEIKNAETDQYLEDSGTVQMMMDLRQAWTKEPHELWPTLENQWCNRCPVDGFPDTFPATPMPTTYLVSYMTWIKLSLKLVRWWILMLVTISTMSDSLADGGVSYQCSLL